MALLQNIKDLFTGAKQRTSARFPEAPFAIKPVEAAPLSPATPITEPPQVQPPAPTVNVGQPNIDTLTGYNYGAPVQGGTVTNTFGQPSVQPPTQKPDPDINAQINSIVSGLQGVQSGIQNVQTQPDDIARRRQEDELIRSMQPSADEQRVSQQLANLQSSAEMGQAAIQDKPIALPFITGQQAALERRAGVLQAPLQRQLALEQSKRQAAVDIGKTRLDIEEKRAERAKLDEEKVGEYTDTDGTPIVVYRDKKTGKTRNVRIEGAKKTPTGTEEQAQKRTQAFAVARPLLNAAKSVGGSVDKATYMKIRQDYAEAIGDVKEFDDVFSVMLSPSDRRDLFRTPTYPGETAILSPFE